MAKADLRLYTLVRRDLHVPAAQRAVTVLTRSGEHAALWYAIGLTATALDRRNAPDYRRAMFGVLATELANTAVKMVFRRHRPALEELPALVKVPTSLSFPSAHSSTSFAAARAFSKHLPARPLYAAAALMAASRVALRVHHASDVLAGAALGMVVAR